MTTVFDTTANRDLDRPWAAVGELVYRFEGTLGDLYPIGLFPEGIRFHNSFEGTVVAGPLTGAKIFGPDLFVLRHDGVGEINAPEVIDDGRRRVALDVRGYVVPPPGSPVPPLEAFLQPGFELPDVAFRITGSALVATAAPDLRHLNQAVVVVEGQVNLATGALIVEARALERAMAVGGSPRRGSAGGVG